MPASAYVLITSARNEELLIGSTIESIVAQTIRPVRWVIVNDGSSDRTGEVVGEYGAKYDFIRLLTLEAQPGRRGFQSKVIAINRAFEILKDMEFELIGILDADITVNPDYYARIFEQFRKNRRLGIAGGMIAEGPNGVFEQLNYNLGSVAGAVQLFRRECYEETGGYIPVEGGIEDAVIEVMARMHGWEVQTFLELTAYHHRITGTKARSLAASKFVAGRQEYILGSHPLFHLGKCIDRFREPPYVVGGLLMLAGYVWAWVRQLERPVSQEFVDYMRTEQKQRMRSPLTELKVADSRSARPRSSLP